MPRPSPARAQDHALLRPESLEALNRRALALILRTPLVHIRADRLGAADHAALAARYEGLARAIFAHVSRDAGARAWGEHPRERWIEVRARSGAARTDGPRAYHTDEAGQRDAADICLMYALRPADAGGDNCYVAASRLLERLRGTEPALAARLLSAPVRFETPAGGVWRPILRLSGGQALARYDRALITDAPNDMLDRFDAFLAAMPDDDRYVARLEPGDAVLWWDAHFIHARTPASRGAGRRRLRKAGIAGCAPTSVIAVDRDDRSQARRAPSPEAHGACRARARGP